MPTFFKYSLIQTCFTKGRLFLASDVSRVSRNCISLRPVSLAKTQAQKAFGTSVSMYQYHTLCHQGPCPSQHWAWIFPSLPFSSEARKEENLVALDMPCQSQFPALTFLTMSVHAWPFCIPHRLPSPSPGRVYAFQLCCCANPNFTSSSFWPVLPKEPVARIANIQGNTPCLSHRKTTTALHRDL